MIYMSNFNKWQNVEDYAGLMMTYNDKNIFNNNKQCLSGTHILHLIIILPSTIALGSSLFFFLF